MHRIAKIGAYVAGGIVALAAIAAGIIYVRSEQIVTRTYDVPLGAFTVVVDSADLAEGQRLATLRGCYGGCHGTTVEGSVFFDEPRVARIAAPNLTAIASEYTDSELERVIRRGVTRDGRSVFAMPSPMFAHLADDDLASIIAFIRSQPVIDGGPRDFHLGPMGRLGIVIGMFEPLAPGITTSPAATVPRGSVEEWGEYLALTICSECHGPDLRGDPRGPAPDLTIAAAYSEEDWFRLLRTGRALGDRELDLMSSVAISRFQYMTDEEIRAVHAFLSSRVSPSTAAR